MFGILVICDQNAMAIEVNRRYPNSMCCLPRRSLARRRVTFLTNQVLCFIPCLLKLLPI
jgi:hypothetical protein